MKIAVITDTHWGVRNNNEHVLNHFEKFYKDVFFRDVLENKIDTIIHLGDLVHKPDSIDYKTAERLKRVFLDRIKENGITLHVVVGNHDTYYRNTNKINALRHLFEDLNYDKIHYYENNPVVLNFDGCDIMLCPWLTKENRDFSLNQIANTTAPILMGHFQIQGFEMRRGKLAERGLAKDVFDGFDAVYSGHFHLPSTQDNISYLGAPYQMDWSDYGGKRGYWIFDTETRQMNFVENHNTLFTQVSYNDEHMSIDDIEGYNFRLLEGRYVKLIIEKCMRPTLYDAFVAEVDRVGVADLQIVDMSIASAQIILEQGTVEDKGTLQLISECVANANASQDMKKRVDNLITELYTDALNI